jgi:hypothetical protein
MYSSKPFWMLYMYTKCIMYSSKPFWMPASDVHNRSQQLRLLKVIIQMVEI